MHIRGGKLEQGEETYGESSCHRRVFQNKLLYSRLPHIMKYREVAVGELLVCKKEPEKASDQYAVAAEKEGTITGHLPRKVSWGVFADLAMGRYYRM